MARRSVKIKEDKAPYIIHYPVPCRQLPSYAPPDLPERGILVVSIDIAYKNFALRIEQRLPNGDINGIYFDRLDFTQFGESLSDTGGTTVITPELMASIEHYITSLQPVLKEVDIVLIERQMGLNYKASRVFQHVLTIFLMMRRLGLLINPKLVICDISPKMKGDKLGAPKGCKGADLKKWSIDKAKELCQWRGDTNSLSVLEFHNKKTKTKADDLADTICQIEAFFLHVGGIRTFPKQA